MSTNLLDSKEVDYLKQMTTDLENLKNQMEQFAQQIVNNKTSI